MQKKILTALTLIIVAMILVTGCKGKKTEKEEKTTVEETTIEETTVDNSHIGQVRSKLTGEYVDEKIGNRRPVAVMYNNIINAIPHSGLSNASVCYEAPVEGCITRIMGIFKITMILKRLVQ